MSEKQRIMGYSEQEVLQRIADTLKRERLNQNLSQSQLSDLSGVSRRTLVQAETGHNTSLATLVKILTALKAEYLLEPLLKEPEISPIELAKLKGKQRKRATGNRGRAEPAEQKNSNNKGEWTW